MRHFGHLAPEMRERLFHRQPCQFTPDADATLLSMALGATLYSPATRPQLADDILKQARQGVISMVLCLEDAIGDADVDDAEDNLIRHLTALFALGRGDRGLTGTASGAVGAIAVAGLGGSGGASGPVEASSTEAGEPAGGTATGAGGSAGGDRAPAQKSAAGRDGATANGLAARDVKDDLPLLFIRVRAPEQIPDLVRRLGPAVALLSGFVLPKFTEDSGVRFLEALAAAEAGSGRRLFAMPVLESPELLHLETRAETLAGIARTVDKYRDRVLAVRLGVTDFCSAYGLRRPPDMTAYDVQIVAGVIGDVVNVLGRADGTGFIVTGPVWEYFRLQERIFKPQLRQSPFHGRAEHLRAALIEHDLDGLLREIELDRANGLLGKTCIHPSHVLPVHALSVVSHEEFTDAQDILRQDRGGGGVLRSTYTNKMNEVKPHRAWAERVLRRAEVFGVARENVGFVELLAAGLAG